MDITDAFEYLAPRHNGVLTTLRRDGRPQQSNVTYWLDGDVIRISVTDDRAKTRNARRDPRVSLHVTADDFWSYVVVDGAAQLTEVASYADDPTCDLLVAYYRVLSGEHPDWADYRRAMVADRRLMLTIIPESAYGFTAR